MRTLHINYSDLLWKPRSEFPHNEFADRRVLINEYLSITLQFFRDSEEGMNDDVSYWFVVDKVDPTPRIDLRTETDRNGVFTLVDDFGNARHFYVNLYQDRVYTLNWWQKVMRFVVLAEYPATSRWTYNWDEDCWDDPELEDSIS